MNLMVVLVAIGLMVLLLVLLRLEVNLREIRKRRTIAAPALKHELPMNVNQRLRFSLIAHRSRNNYILPLQILLVFSLLCFFKQKEEFVDFRK